MKLSKQDLLKKINEKITDVDLATELIEDVEDSFESDTEQLEQQLNDLKVKNEELKQKYKDRFLTGDVDVDPTKKKNVEVDENETEEPRKFENLFNEKGDLK